MHSAHRTFRKGLHAAPGIFLGLLFAAPLGAQSSPELQQILTRLERLEQQNRELMQEVHSLREELATARPRPAQETAPPPSETVPLDERVAVAERRIDEQAQSKVESSQRFPLRVTGIALFNTYLNSKQGGGAEYPTIASAPGAATGGATLRQTVLGLEYQGPETFAGGRVKGSLYMDFFPAGTQALRIRTGDVELDWGSRSLLAGLEKPIFNPREPNSLAQVGISPLTGAGNLWLWIPQLRFEQDFSFGPRTGLRAQVGVVQTRESQSYQAGNYVPELEAARPGLEGRFEFFHRLDDDRRIEFAPGFHQSVSHVADSSVASNLVSLDWFANPWRKLEFTGALYSGQNVAHLGTGAIRQGFVVFGDGNVRPVHGKGGWAQLTWLATRRLSFNLFAGRQDDRNRDLLQGWIGYNQAYGANFFYRLAPNVLMSLETSQVRTSYIGGNLLRNNHYDLALAYLF
ncbi:MAG TPA: hypothetical protein VFA33_19795 [Bryobacteraceae bacterium]|nr:hypothetical protein [Bryobacteraceae bacterium]